jgi:hypothetical protein
MKKWDELKSEEKAAVVTAQRLITKEDANFEELQKMMKVEEFLNQRGINSYDYNIEKMKSFNELQPEMLKEFLE